MPTTGISVPSPQVIASRVPTPGAIVRSNWPSLERLRGDRTQNALAEHVGEAEGRGRGHADRHDHGDRESGISATVSSTKMMPPRNPQHQVDDRLAKRRVQCRHLLGPRSVDRRAAANG